MISLKELLGKYDFNVLPKEHQGNIMTLLERINRVRTAYNKGMVPTNSYRSMADHLRIYKEKGITDPAKIPMKSKHLFGQAVDIADPKGELQKWCKANEPLLLKIGFWMEDFGATPGWCHFQIVQYGSWVPGKTIWFKI